MLSNSRSALCRNFEYAGFKSLYALVCRSKVTVAVKETKCRKDTALILYNCQVPYPEHIEKAQGLFKNYKKRITKSSKICQKVFTLNNIAKAYMKFDLLTMELKNLKKARRISLPLYSLLMDPCYLLIAFSSLKKTKGSGIDDIPVENITLSSLCTLAKQLQDRSYQPNPTKRIFISKTNGKMRPLGIASSKDKVIQQAIYLVLTEVFEPMFLECSHGFRKNKSCHSALGTVYHR